MTDLFTIGYEKAASSEVMAALATAGIATLIDVRDRPQSRRAGFSKRQLQATVEAAGMRYVHLKALGTPPEGREANRRRDWGRFWRIVEERLASPEAEVELEQTAAMAQEAPSCLLCYEADWRICHRRRIAEILAERHRFAIRHLAAMRDDA
jgi:uncharacterized protein (DUF488 family)